MHLLLVVHEEEKKTLKPRQSRSKPSQSVYETFKQLNGSSRSVLLAANRINDLPVTIPINLAIHLAEKGKCLLIDFDIKRDAMAMAFGVDSSKIDTDLIIRPVPSSIENLEIWPAGFFDCYKHMNLGMLLDTARKKYDHILLYAPYLPVLPDRKQIAYVARQAIVFSKTDDTDSPLYQLLKSQNCAVVTQR